MIELKCSLCGGSLNYKDETWAYCPSCELYPKLLGSIAGGKPLMDSVNLENKRILSPLLSAR